MPDYHQRASSAKSSLSNYLEALGSNLSTFVDHVRSKAHDAQLVFVSGSVIDGLGNSSSDIDVYVIAHNKSSEAASFYLFKKIPIDLEFWDIEVCRSLIQKLHDVASSGAIDPRTTMRLIPHEIDFLHRLRIGLPIIGEAIFQELSDIVDKLLSRVLLYRAIAKYPPLLDDLLGIRLANIDEQLLAAQKLGAVATDIVLRLYNETNPSDKWRLGCIDRLCGDEGSQPSLPITLASALKDSLTMWNAHKCPKTYVQHSTWLAISAYSVAELFIADYASSPSDEFKRLEAALLANMDVTQTHPQLPLDLLVERYESAWVIRRRTKSATFRVNASTLRALPLFTGSLSLEQAAGLFSLHTPATSSEVSEAFFDFANVLIADEILLTPNVSTSLRYTLRSECHAF